MSTISVGLPSDGDTIDVADYNTPINTIVNEINGNLDNSNISSGAAISGSKLASGTVTSTQLDFGGSGAGVWWEEIGRTVLGTAGDTITVNSLPNRKYLKVMVSVAATGGTINAAIRYNNDSGSNYAVRSSSNGGVDGTAVSQTFAAIAATLSAADKFISIEIFNEATKEKIHYGNTVERGTAGAGNAPDKAEVVGKWANTANVISRIDILNQNGTGDFAIGSEVIVLGHN